MPIFGQVWLWSTLAFLLGALLCWLLVARPARARVASLQTKLATLARRQQAAEKSAAAKLPVRHEDDEAFSSSRTAYADEIRRQNDSLSRAYVPTPDPFDEPPSPPRSYEEPPSPPRSYEDPPSPPRGLSPIDGLLSGPPETDTELADTTNRGASATRYISVTAGSLDAPAPPAGVPDDRGWFDDEAAEEEPPVGHTTQLPIPSADIDRRLVDDDVHEDVEEDFEPVPVEPAARAQPPSALLDEESGTIFTQRTIPVPSSVISELDEAERAPASASVEETALIDDLADDLADEPVGESVAARLDPDVEPPTQLVEPETQVVEAATQFVEPATQFVDQQTRVVDPDPTQTVAPSNGSAPEPAPGFEETTVMPGVTVTAEAGTNVLPKRVPGKPTHRTPFGVKTEPAPVAATGGSDDLTRSLFEPVVPAAEDEETVVPPPPHRMRGGDGTAAGRGPFGPGSAMPLPGGGSPSPEYTIKASVTALRYCAPESPQFGRTVAEVWFRSAADAERVGFRPVG